MCRKKTIFPLLLASSIFVLSGCTKQKYKNLQITVESFPSGADVYGVAGLVPGDLIGKTPLVLVYVNKRRGILGILPDQTIEYTETHLAFKCYIKKEGYGTYRIYEVIEKASLDSEGFPTPPDFGGRITYAAGLYPLPDYGAGHTPLERPVIRR